jgi:hypothetical protein
LRNVTFRNRSAIKMFRSDVAKEFAFLTSDFGFHEDPARLKNPFSVSYVNATTRILIEGINWGAAARVAFGSAGPLEKFENFDILDFAFIRCPDKAAAATAMNRPSDQGSHLKVLAEVLRECGVEALNGDFSSAPRIRELREQRMRDWEREEAARGRPRPARPEE